MPFDIISVSARLAHCFMDLVRDSLLRTGARGNLVAQAENEVFTPFVRDRLAALYAGAAHGGEVPEAWIAANHAACCAVAPDAPHGAHADAVRAHIQRARYVYAVKAFAAEVHASGDSDAFSRSRVLALVTEFWCEATRQRALLLAARPVEHASDLRCAICIERYTSGSAVVIPRPCAHTFCRPCLAYWEGVAGVGELGAPFPCPYCKGPIESYRSAEDVMGLLRRLRA